MQVKICSKRFIDADELELEVNRSCRTIEAKEGRVLDIAVTPMRNFDGPVLIATITYEEAK